MDETESYIYIQEEEYEKLSKSSSRLRAIEDALSLKNAFIHSEVEKQILDKVSRIEKRNAEFQKFVYDLNGELKYYEIENQRRLNEQNQKLAFLRNEYMQVLYKERQEYTALFRQQEEKLAELINKGNFDKKNTLNKLKDDIENLLADYSRKKDKVTEFIHEIGKIVNETAKLPHKKFAPGQMDKILFTYKQACFDLKEEFFESALMAGRNVYLELVELRDLIQENEYKLISFQAYVSEKLLSLIEKIKLNKTRVLEFDRPDKKYFFEVNINYWSFEKLEKLKIAAEKLYNEVKVNEDTDSSRLEKINNTLDKNEKELELVINKAVDNIIKSHLRANKAELLSILLKEMFYSVKDSFYQNNDKRNDYCLQLKNLSGKELKIIIKTNDEIHISSAGKNTVLKELYEVINECLKADSQYFP